MEPTQEEQAHAFTMEVCKGNREAAQFCDLFYRLGHQLDDLVDCKEDGRPTMSNEKIIELWAITALMYNCSYYVRHRQHLFPIILQVTNLWATSVAWEKSPIKHRRIMGDVLRTVGDHVFFMVAMLEGGYSHMRAVTDKIMETDYLRQHDAEGNPI